MKKAVYVGAIFWLGMVFTIQSCEKDAITPNTTPSANNDSIFNPNDSTGNGGGNSGGNGTDSTGWTNPGGNGGNSGGGSGTDSTSTGGNTNPNDSTGLGGN